MSKKRKHRRARPSKAQPRRTSKAQKVIVTEYTVTYEPLENTELLALPEDDQEEINELIFMVGTNPRSALAGFKKMAKKYPHIAILQNNIASAYSHLGENEKAYKLIKETYERFPDYLFGKINYAQFCLDRGDIDKIPDIFNNTYDLKMLYPERSVFHVAEVMSFSYVMAIYCIRIGRLDTAKVYYSTMKKVHPESEMLPKLEVLLGPSILLDRLKTDARKQLR
jgi:tetratricopeptide (TPR) repeat protein